MSRPSEYTEDGAVKLCVLIGDGMLLPDACKDLGISKSTFYAWLKAQPDFVTMYEAAKLEHADAIYDQSLKVASEDVPKDDHGRTDTGRVNQLRLIVETLHHRAARLAPKKYHAQRIELTGAEGAPLAAGPPTEEQIFEGARRIAFLLQRALVKQEEKPPEPLRLVHEKKA